ncbi:MAG: alpha-mannosidase, partial [Ignavibacteriae bacterium]|nr:alpha-mannosidase [Ignavibacteriota bacterium]
GIENWIGASNNNFGVTLSSCVAVADYIDPTNTNSTIPVLQPILLASRKSCHGEGNEYLQTGDHHYRFSLTSHKSSWQNGFTFGKQANEKLIVVVNPKQYVNSSLPEEKSFFSVNQGNVIISTIKKAEDDNSVVVRLYDALGKDSNIELNSFYNISSARSTNLIEVDEAAINYENNRIQIILGNNSIHTMKVFYNKK